MSLPVFYKLKDKFFDVATNQEVDIKEVSYGFVISKKGLFSILVSKGHSIIRPAKTELERFDEIEEEVTYNYPKVSYAIYSKALQFFREVYKKHQSEGALLLVLNRTQPLEEQEYKIYIPKQQVSTAGVDYTVDHSELGKDEFLAGSIHSHPDFDAFQSGVDEEDEFTFDGVHLTFGHIQQTVPDIHGRVVLARQSYEAKDLIEIAPPSSDTIPEDWMKKVEKETYNAIVGNYMNNYGNYGYNGWGEEIYHNQNRNKNSQQYNFSSNSVEELIAAMKPKNLVNNKHTKKLKPILK